MIFILLTILSSSSIGLILKQSDIKKGEPVVLLSANYFVASIITIIFIFSDNQTSFSAESFGFGAVLGLMFVIGFFVFAKSVGVAGAALSSVSSRLSVVVPFIFSIIFFNEIPEFNQIIGFGFAIATIILFYFSLRSMRLSGIHLKIKDYLYLLTLFLAIGINDFAMKIFQQWRPITEKPFFLFSIFTFAFLYTLLFIFVKKIRVDKATILRGGILGIPNVFSSIFLLNALNDLPAILVYPVVNIGIILLTTLAASLIWHERLNTFGKWAILLGIITIVLLTI